ncbi:MAG: phage portal protein [Chloroherpetonaceae bacterium]|nr:phage portal protein [Chloroherpetonaceae bacterium]
MSFFQRIQAAVKSFGIAFAGVAGRERPLTRFGTVGSNVPWERLAGEFWDCAASYACYRAIALNYTQARPCLQRRMDGGWESIDRHPVVELLEKPYLPYMDGSTLAWAYLGSLLACGNAYIGIESNASGLPVRLRWLPHDLITPHREPGSDQLIDYYVYRPDGTTQVRIAVEDMIHLRIGVDLNDARYGVSGWRSLVRQQYTLHQALNFNANVLRNAGVPFALACPSSDQVTMDVQGFVEMAKSKLSGDKVGEWMACDIPVTLTFPDVTPENMALDTMQDRPESDISAVFGVPPQVAGLHVGRLSRTYANVREARESFWEETIIPLLNLVYSQMGMRLLPRYGLDLDTYRIAPDISTIRPLQPDRDALHARVREDYRAGLISLAEALIETGRVPQPGDENIYSGGVRGMPAQSGGGRPRDDGRTPSRDAESSGMEEPVPGTRVAATRISVKQVRDLYGYGRNGDSDILREHGAGE